MNTITSFTGNNFFLSNFYPSPFKYTLFDNVYEFKTNEHFFQAYKAVRKEDAEKVINCETPNKAKYIGRSIEIKSIWDKIKNDVMYIGLREKFTDKNLRKMLLNTSDAILIEGNSWNDTYWGECPLGNGKNMLGKMLMTLRDFYFINEHIKIGY